MLSVLWAMLGIGATWVGLSVWADARAAGGLMGWLGELASTGLTIVGVSVVIAAVVGSVFGVRLMRELGTAGPAAYFGLIAGGSGVVLLYDFPLEDTAPSSARSTAASSEFIPSDTLVAEITEPVLGLDE